MRIEPFSLERLINDPQGHAAKNLAYGLLPPMILAVSISISFFTALSALFTFFSVISIIRSREWSFFKEIFFKLILIYLVMNILSLTQTEFWPESLRGFFKVLRHVLLFVGLVHTLDSHERIVRLAPFFFIGAALVSLDAFFQSGTGRDLFNQRRMTAYSGETGRLTGPFKHANDFSAYLSAVGTLFLGIILDGVRFIPRKKYVFYMAGFAMVVLCLLWTYSRSGWLAFTIVAVVMGIVKKNKVLLVAIGAVLIWGIFFSPPLVKMRIDSTWDTHGGTVKERRVLWGEAARMIQASPALGLGVNTYSRNERFYRSPEARTDYQYAHNGYLQMAAEIGLLGLASFLAMICFFIFKCSQVFISGGRDTSYLRSLGTAFLFAVIALLIHGVFDTNLHSLLLINLLWICLGCAWVIRRELLR